ATSCSNARSWRPPAGCCMGELPPAWAVRGGESSGSCGGNELEGSAGLLRMQAVVPGSQPEREIEALRPSLLMHADPRPVLRRRSLPETEVRCAECFEQREQLFGVGIRVA